MKIDIGRLYKKIRRELYKGLSKRISITSARTRFKGLNLKIPLVYGLGADHLCRLETPWTYYFLQSLLKDKPGALIDIGANVGLYLVWLKSIEASREYIGFEPNPACYWYLHEVIRYNQFESSQVFPLALSDIRQLSTFFARRLGDKMGSLLANHRIEKEKPNSFNLITEPGDPIIQKFGLSAISVIKIDVEGFELEVVNGLKDTLAKYHPTVICEVLTPNPGRADYEAGISRIEKFLAIIHSCNYIALSLSADNEFHEISEALDFQTHKQVDRILVHQDQLGSVMKSWGRAKEAIARQPVL